MFSTSLALARSPLPFHSEPPCSIPGPQTAAHLFSVYNLPFLSVMYEYSHAHVAAGVCFLPLCMVLQGSSPLLSMVVCPFGWMASRVWTGCVLSTCLPADRRCGCSQVLAFGRSAFCRCLSLASETLSEELHLEPSTEGEERGLSLPGSPASSSA